MFSSFWCCCKVRTYLKRCQRRLKMFAKRDSLKNKLRNNISIKSINISKMYCLKCSIKYLNWTLFIEFCLLYYLAGSLSGILFINVNYNCNKSFNEYKLPLIAPTTIKVIQIWMRKWQCLIRVNLHLQRSFHCTIMCVNYPARNMV